MGSEELRREKKTEKGKVGFEPRLTDVIAIRHV
jgi:hypothetical protein